MQSGQLARPEALYATDRYLPVFLLLVAALGTATFAEGSQVAFVAVSLAVISAVVGTLRATGSSPKRMNLVLVGAGLSAVAVVLAPAADVDGFSISVSLGVAAAMAYGVFALVRRIFEQPRLGVREVIAALAAYIEIALVFAFAYSAVGQATVESLFTDGRPGQIGDYVYFSVVTITTLGYGDLAPATDLGRSLVIIETLFGQIFLVVLVAYLVGSIGRERPHSRK